jgi:type II secretory ATPase GspE/PulE/Tfp pilus assembly ATPase PilB-like protein
MDPPISTFVAEGCGQCAGQGFRGRSALGEAFLADTTFLRMIAEGAQLEPLAAETRKCGLKAMVVDGAEKVVEGVTSTDEVWAAFNA